MVIGNLTAAVILMKGARHFLDDARRLQLGDALARFAVGLTIKVVIGVLFNCFVLALPIAGLIYYIHYLAEDR